MSAIGFELYHPALSRLNVGEALEQFREHLGGELCITLPDGLGKKLEVHEIDVPLMKSCILALAERAHRRDARRSERMAPHWGTG